MCSSDLGVASQAWRMIVRLGGNSAAGTRHPRIWAEGIYPGGQSEIPGSPWYSNFLDGWRNGGYILMPSAGGAPTGQIRWVLVP